MKAKSAKPAKASQATNKPKPGAKIPVKVIAKKPVVKPTVKPKSVPKLAPKAAAKPAVKPAAKFATKSAVKPAAKAKPVVKTPAAKAPPAKAPVKATGKPVAKVVVKPVPKLLTKGVVKTSVKSKLEPSVVSKNVTPTAKPTAPTGQPKSALASNGLPPPPPLKPGRRSSSRALAHMPPPAPMVPTHAPDAAKASYSTMTERVIAPPPHVAAKKDPKLANNWKTKTFDTLTDEEVKAMPDAEYMNDKQLAFFRHRLSILKQDIHNSAGATTEHLREDTSVVPDPADRATIEEEHALELRTRDRERKLLKKIEQSISRIDSGDYGYCDETGEPIGVGRLIARPTASLSLEAQQRRELKQKMFGD